MTPERRDNRPGPRSGLQQTPIAVIGMACIFPRARNLRAYWNNIINKVDCITDVPADRWDVQDYFDRDPRAADKTFSKRGGFLPDIEFDPMEFGIPPNLLEQTDVSQLLSLVVAQKALEDAGYGAPDRCDRDRVGVVLGFVGINSQLKTPLASRLQYPVWAKVLRKSGISEDDAGILIEKIKRAYVGWEENSLPGSLGNIIAGRIANRLNLGGVNCVVDAACASSLSALKVAASELLEYRSDLMITGGVDVDSSIFVYVSFSKTPALTPGDRCTPFDIDANGMMLGEGIGMVVLKRLADAERDHDRIYAVIRGVGSSSDGRFTSIYNPVPLGQVKALSRAYDDSGIDPSSVELIEAHGTGTPAGDRAELEALTTVFDHAHARKGSIALGSVKSQIGHTKAAAGAAGLIKAVLALHHKVLPPTINVSTPNPQLGTEQSPFYLNTETRPWIHSDGASPRRAAVSAFGFGGTNFHVVLEEFQRGAAGPYRLDDTPRAIVLSASTPRELAERCGELSRRLDSAGAEAHFRELQRASRSSLIPAPAARIGFVSESAADSRELLGLAINALRDRGADDSWDLPKGVHYRRQGMDLRGTVVALFSGQGSQYVDMGRELVSAFPPMMDAYQAVDRLFVQDGWSPVSKAVFPIPAFDPAQRRADEERLRKTEIAQPAIGAFSAGLYRVLAHAGFQPDFVAGHSFGELTALWAAQVLSDDDFFLLARARGKAMAAPDEVGRDAGSMMAVLGDVQGIQSDLVTHPAVTVANVNSKQEVVIAGPTKELAAVRGSLERKGYHVIPLPVSAAFHTPLVGHAQEPFAEAIRAVAFRSPRHPVYSNATAKPYPTASEEIQAMLAAHILSPVLFKEQIENIYGDGGRLFVEFGPKGVLTKLVDNILEGRPHIAIALNASPTRGSDLQLRQAVVRLRVAGLPLDDVDRYQLDQPMAEEGQGSPIIVKLNASNFVSNRTRSAFMDSLNDGHRMGSSSPSAETPPAAPLGSGGERASAPAAEPVVEAIASTSKPPPAGDSSVDSARVFESIGQALSDFCRHQGEILQVHEQYLKNHLEYVRTSHELMREQHSLLARDSSADLTDIIDRGMTLFHRHQEETLRAHDQFLRSQAEIAQSALDVIRHQSSGLTGATPPSMRAAGPAQARPPLSGPAARSVVGPRDTSPRGPVPAIAPVAPVVPVVPFVRVAPVTSSRVEGPVRGVPPSVPNRPVPTAAAPAAAPGSDALTRSLLEVVSEKTGYPVDMLELDMEVEADLGIDSIKRVEILGAMADRHPELPDFKIEELAELRTLTEVVAYMTARLPAPRPAAPGLPAAPPAASGTPAPRPAAAPGSEALTRSLLEVVSEKTGYPVDMLELDMEVEADLGIDSIKRVEILGAMADRHPELPDFKIEELAELRTLTEVVAYMTARLPAPRPAAPGLPAAPPAASGTPAPRPAAAPGSEALTRSLLEVVSEKTGYPVDMLELDMEVEADLGIDSIKRVEILGAMADRHPELPDFKIEELAELRTLIEVVAYMTARLPAPRPAAPGLPAAPPAASGTPAPRPAAAPGSEALTRSLLEVVSEKTGYPVDMLELDMEVEADLGIDSIKRVEILGAMADRHPELPDFKIEELAELRTLIEVVAYMTARLPAPRPGVSAPPLAAARAGDQADVAREATRSIATTGNSTPWGFVRLEPLPPPDFLEFTLPQDHCCLITDDGSPVTVKVAESLEKQGWKVVVLGFPASAISEGPPLAQGVPRIYLEDFSERHLQDTLEAISREHGRIGGFIHLNPPSGRLEEGEIIRSDHGKQILLHVFLMAKHLKASLGAGASAGRRVFMTIARMNGSLGVGSGEFNAIDGGLFGLTKTLSLEWPSVFCRAVDISPELDTDSAASSILHELHDPQSDLVETGYSPEGRATLVSDGRTAPGRSAKTPIPPSSVFLVSGGARGVTAKCVARLAAASRCKFILVGRSEFSREEPPWARGCDDETTLKTLALEALTAHDHRPSPAKVQELLRSVLANREIAATLKAVQEAGGVAEYVNADVRDTAALEKLRPVVRRLGTITGIIHGAGVLADRLIDKKTVRDFESVYSTKVKGLEALLRFAAGPDLKHLVLFSSAAGFFGNPGQSDYAMANEILNKAAHRCQRLYPDCHVTCIDWGPWDGGMVTDALKKLFADRNVQVIPISAGTEVFLEALTRPSGSTPQLLVGDSSLPGRSELGGPQSGPRAR